MWAVVWGAVLAACSIPFPWSFLSPIPLAALFVVLANSPKPAQSGFWAMTVFFALHLIWLPISFWALFGPMAISFVLLFLLEGGFWAILLTIVSRISSRASERVWLLAVGWVLLEWLRHLGPFAFPWGTLGYTLAPIPVVQTADIWGTLGLSSLVTLLAAALARAYQGERRPILAMAAVWASALVYGRSRNMPQGTTQSVRLAQGNIDPIDKVKAQIDPLPVYIQLTQGPAVDVTIWPESAIYGWHLGNLLPNQLISGVGVRTSPTTVANRVLSWAGSKEVSHYDKTRLVPFGEYFPLLKAWPAAYAVIFKAFNMPMLSGTEPDTAYRSLELSGHRYGAYVCYESVFPEVAEHMVKNGALVLVNVSNDGWFGKTIGVEQHFVMGNMRAIELRRYVLRAGNVGVTAIVDPLGRVVRRIPTHQTGILDGSFQLLNGRTLYSRFGDWPVLILLGIAALGLSYRARQQKPPQA